MWRKTKGAGNSVSTVTRTLEDILITFAAQWEIEKEPKVKERHV